MNRQRGLSRPDNTISLDLFAILINDMYSQRNHSLFASIRSAIELLHSFYGKTK